MSKSEVQSFNLSSVPDDAVVQCLIHLIVWLQYINQVKQDAISLMTYSCDIYLSRYSDANNATLNQDAK